MYIFLGFSQLHSKLVAVSSRAGGSLGDWVTCWGSIASKATFHENWDTRNHRSRKPIQQRDPASGQPRLTCLPSCTPRKLVLHTGVPCCIWSVCRMPPTALNVAHFFNAATAWRIVSFPKQIASTLYSSTSSSSPTLPICLPNVSLITLLPYQLSPTCGFAASPGLNCPVPLVVKQHSV